MSKTSFLQSPYLLYLSSPAADRPVYRAIRRHRVRTVLELGIGDGRRAQRMIEMAAQYAPIEEIRYAGIDLFEGRTAADGPGVNLKLAYRMLNGTGAKVQLVPGDPFSGLARAANSLRQVDLIVVSARLDREQLSRAWFYVPRLLHEKTVVLQESILAGGRLQMQQLALEEIEQLAASTAARRAA